MTQPGDAGFVSIGALARATGIPVETLRTWERRYGYPAPRRKASGHRVYDVEAIPRLRRIALALARGMRAGDVVSASDTEITALLDVTSPAPGPATAPHAGLAAPVAHADGDIEPLLQAVARFDGERLTRMLRDDWAQLGPMAFLQSRIAPLVRAVGDAWERGELRVHHEHFLSERVGDLLRGFRVPFEERAWGPLALLATLPGENHGLGLQMAALVLVVVGWRVLYLGTDVPVDDLVGLAGDMDARAVALSVSAATAGNGSVAGLREVRAALPATVALVVGGDGAPPAGDPASDPASGGVQVIQDLEKLCGWARALMTGARGSG